MQGYSRDKSDFREKLVLKYNHYIMKDFILVTTPDCVKCKFIKPSVEKWCKENWYLFKETEYTEWMTEITSVPTAIIGEEVLDYEAILHLITK